MKWQDVYDGGQECLERFPVRGGWLYRSSQDQGNLHPTESMVFVEDNVGDALHRTQRSEEVRQA